MSQKTDIWMPLYVADYQADTAYLTTEQSGAYLFLLMAYWRNGPPPDNDAILASITRLSPDAWSNTRGILQAFFDVSDGKWLHKRVEQELDKAKKNRDFAHKRALNGANARWGKARGMLEAMPEALPEHMLEQCTSPSPSPSPSSLQATAGSQNGAGAPTHSPDEPQKRQAKRKRDDSTLTDWLANLEGPAVPDDDPLWAYAQTTGIPDDAIAIAWEAFKDRYATKPKKYKDWLAAFRDHVKGNYLKLWFFDQQGAFRLTPAGIQAKRLSDGT